MPSIPDPPPVEPGGGAGPGTPRPAGKATLYRDPARPPALTPPDPAGVPAELQAAPRWVVWKLEWVNRTWSKVPYRADGRGKASATNPATWGTFAAAVAAGAGAGVAGLGFVLGDGFAGVDLDDVRDPGPAGWCPGRRRRSKPSAATPRRPRAAPG